MSGAIKRVVVPCLWLLPLFLESRKNMIIPWGSWTFALAAPLPRRRFTSGLLCRSGLWFYHEFLIDSRGLDESWLESLFSCGLSQRSPHSSCTLHERHNRSLLLTPFLDFLLAALGSFKECLTGTNSTEDCPVLTLNSAVIVFTADMSLIHLLRFRTRIHVSGKGVLDIAYHLLLSTWKQAMALAPTTFMLCSKWSYTYWSI